MDEHQEHSEETESTPRENPFYREARRLMVERQLIERGIRDPRVLQAMAEVPRHAFVLPTYQPASYEDRPLEIGWGQTISQPYMVAHMAEQLRLRPEDRVLEIGTGSGYAAAVLSRLARHVYTIERNENLAHTAAFRMQSLGYSNVTVILGDGTLGYSKGAPYDAIVVSAAAPRAPEPLKDQLSVGGRLLCPVGDQESQTLVRITRTADGFTVEEGIRCMFVPLVGREGWASE
jgi:protein-L-isoaspartate(D-aspartate) O-methyltransferase